MSGMSLDEFLGHKSSERGGGKILNWRKRKPPILTTWLHTQAPFVALWRHGFPRIVDITRDGEKVREVWGGNFNCWEKEEVLKKQYRRDRDGRRMVPPESCPLCLLAEYLRAEVEAGRLSWVEPVFEFEADDPRASVTLTAAGIYNGFNGDLSRQEIAELRKAGIRRDEAWKQNTMAKCAYVFTVVDDGSPGDGVQVCVETTALGDAVKRVARDQMDALGEVEGHPLKTPYAIRWEYHPDEQAFDQKYRALALPKVPLSPEVRALIVDAPPPDIQGLIQRGDALALRAVMEMASKIDLPFDALFKAMGAQVPATQAQRPAVVQRPPRTGRRDAPEPEPARETAEPRRRRATRPAEPVMPDYPAGTILIPCDACGAKMADTDEECWKCGARYDLEPLPPKKGPDPKSRAHLDGEADGPVGAEDDLPW